MTLTPKQREAFDAACRLISPERARQIQQIKSWQNGMALCRTTPKPTHPEVSSEENEAINVLWLTLSGNSCWMDAIHMVLHREQYQEVQA